MINYGNEEFRPIYGLILKFVFLSPLNKKENFTLTVKQVLDVKEIFLSFLRRIVFFNTEHYSLGLYVKYQGERKLSFKSSLELGVTIDYGAIQLNENLVRMR